MVGSSNLSGRATKHLKFIRYSHRAFSIQSDSPQLGGRVHDCLIGLDRKIPGRLVIEQTFGLIQHALESHYGTRRFNRFISFYPLGAKSAGQVAINETKVCFNRGFPVIIYFIETISSFFLL